MINKQDIKKFAKKVIPIRYHNFVRNRIVPLLRQMRHGVKMIGLGGGSVPSDQFDELLRRSEETDRMILGFLKLSDMSSATNIDILARLESIDAKLQELTSQIQQIAGLSTVGSKLEQPENVEIDKPPV